MVIKSSNLSIHDLLLPQGFKGLIMKETRIQLFDQNCISQLNLSLIFFKASPVVVLTVLKLNKRNRERFNNHD